MTDFTDTFNGQLSSYYKYVLNNVELTLEIKTLLLNRLITPFNYGMDVGTDTLEYTTMSELMIDRDIGLGTFIIKKDGTVIPLSTAQELAIWECELHNEEDNILENRGPCDIWQPITEDKQSKKREGLYKAACEANDPLLQREAAMDWIMDMDSREFQDKLLNDSLPVFERENEEIGTLQRDTCHPYNIMTDKQHDAMSFNQGYLKRHHLRYKSVDNYKMDYYDTSR